MASDKVTISPSTKNPDRLTKQRVLIANEAVDAAKRYQYLIGQTDIFKHFLNVTKMKSKDKKQYDDYVAESKSAGTGGRKRKTEKEEDEELLNEVDNEEADASFNFEESPAYITGGTMRDYQVQGLNWLISLYNNGINGILADEMGLGKTLQTISFLGYLYHHLDVKGPHLIIVPKSTLHNWVSEVKRWCPTLKPILFHGDKDERQDLIKDVLFDTEWNICVTSYEMCIIEKAALRKFNWEYMIIDEAHRIKNENSLLSKIVRIIQCRNRLLITGTPLQNELHELWALLNFLLPDVFSSSEDFQTWFTVDQEGDQDKVVKQLHKILRPFLLRRIKSDVEKSLLPKKRIDLYVGMSAMQRQWYRKLLEKDIGALNGSDLKQGSIKRLQNIVMQLRKCCNHPYLFDGAEPGPPYTTDQHIVDNAGKLVILDKLLERLKAQGSRVLIFSQMSRMVDILEDYCYWKGFQYCRLDGQTQHADRISAIDEFNKPDSEKFIFLLTTRAGGLGINLATADAVIMYDNDWNPQVDLQAEDRAHRIGQKKQVVIFRFITENAIEEKVIDRATQKLRLDQLVIQQARHVVQKKEGAHDLVAMIRYGAESIFQNQDSTIGSDNLDEILGRSEAKAKQLQSKYNNMGLDDLQQFTTDQSFNAYNWEGEEFNKKGKNVDWIGPSRRERKTNYDSLNFSRGTGVQGNRRDRAMRPRGQILVHDFQFFPPRLEELQEKERYYYWKTQEVTLNQIDGPPEDSEKYDEWAEKEQALIDNAEPLTEEEVAEKEMLMSLGFSDWSKREFNLYLKAMEKHGRYNLEDIATELIDDKTIDQIKKYSDVFWQRYKELADWEKILANIEKGEQKIQKIIETNEIISQKIAQYRAPLQQIRFNYGQNKGKAYSEEEDRFLLCMMNKYRFGRDDIYDQIRAEIKKSPLFRFDWFIKSRTSIELNRRCQTLIMLIEKEFGVGEDRKRKQPATVLATSDSSSKKKSKQV